MRFFLILFLLVLSAAAGWITGSLHPAPPAILTPIQNWIAGGDDATSEILQDLDAAVDAEPTDANVPADPPVTAEPEPEPERESSPATFESKEAALAQYRIWISEARTTHPYPESEDRMYEVMMCESGGAADIVNPAGPYIGLFQYVEGTWNGEWNTYRDQGMVDAQAQIFATALAWSIGMQSHWGCYTRAH